MIYNSGTKIIRVGNINKISDQNQTVFQYIKAADSPAPPPPHDYSQDYLTFEALESGTFRFSGNSVNYSLDSGTTWTSLANNTESPTVNAGEKIMFKATLVPSTSYPQGIGKFRSTGRYNVMGNPYSLLDEDNFRTITDLSYYPCALFNLFDYEGNLVSAEHLSLPADTLASRCYHGMFANCSGLTSAPELPATNLEDRCYWAMFTWCTSLTTAPELPATTMASSAYSEMFEDCHSLTTAPELPATTLAQQCYYQMFEGCSALTTPPELPAPVMAVSAYTGMFDNCHSLTTAPVLSATTLADSCYKQMFLGCYALTSAPELPATSLEAKCYQSMFYECTSLTSAPVLSAATLADYCYEGMLQGCTSLNYIKMLATDISATSCLSNWVYRVAASGTFVKDASMTTLPTGNSGIPTGWTVQDNV